MLLCIWLIWGLEARQDAAPPAGGAGVVGHPLLAELLGGGMPLGFAREELGARYGRGRDGALPSLGGGGVIRGICGPGRWFGRWGP